MINVSNDYKKAMSEYRRERAFISVGIGIINQDAQENGKANGQFEYWSKGNVFNATQSRVEYATLEENYNKADGSKLFVPENNELMQLNYNGIVTSDVIDVVRIDFAEVYSGTQTEFCDKQLDNRKSYVYRLDKIRGTKTFIGTKYAYAVCSDVIKDLYEDNDTKEKATYLELDCSCNLFFAPFYDSVINDEDWFCVKIPPRRTAEIVVNIKKGSNDVLQFNLDTQKPEQIHNGIAFTITNEFFEDKIIPFCISVNPENISSFVEIDYEISLQNIIPKK